MIPFAFSLTYTESVYIIKVGIYEIRIQEVQDEARKKRMLASAFVMVRNKTGMNRKEFAAWLGIPYRTMQDWELGNSQVPEYVLRLVAYKVMSEKERGNI